MLLSTRTLLAGNLLMLACLTVVIAVRSDEDQTTAQDVAVGRQRPLSSAPPALEAARGEETASESAVAGLENPVARKALPGTDPGGNETAKDETALSRHGPLLFPIHPPYRSQPIKAETVTGVVESPVDETSPYREEAEETRPHELDEEESDEVEGPSDEVAREVPGEVPDEVPDDVPGEAADDVRGEVSDELPGEVPDEVAGEVANEIPNATLPEEPAAAEPEPRPELTPAQVALRDRVRRTLAAFHNRPLNIRDNTATELMHLCLAFGCNSEVYRDGSSRKKINGITCLCWNYPCAGHKPLGYNGGRIAARIGYGLQESDSQLLAVLALSRVPPTYPVRVGDDTRTVADLVESEKLSCRTGIDLSRKLIALAYYAGDNPTWKNDLGEDWSLERIIKEELAKPIVGVGSQQTRRLMGLGYAVRRRAQHGKPLEGQFRRAEKFLDEYYQYALRLQHSDGSWGPRRNSSARSGRNPTAQLRTNGHLLEWLAVSSPEDRLDDPRLLRSVEYVNRLLGSQRYYRNLGALTTREIGWVMHALHGLAVYEDRFFKPRTPQQPAPDATRQAARRR